MRINCVIIIGKTKHIFQKMHSIIIIIFILLHAALYLKKISILVSLEFLKIANNQLRT